MDKRRTQRMTIDLPTVCRMPATPRAVRVSDVSQGGCRIDLRGGHVAPGHSIAIDLPATAGHPGEVVWTDGTSAGVRFSRPVRSATAQALGIEDALEIERIEVAKREPPRSPGGFRHWYRRLFDPASVGASEALASPVRERRRLAR